MRMKKAVAVLAIAACDITIPERRVTTTAMQEDTLSAADIQFNLRSLLGRLSRTSTTINVELKDLVQRARWSHVGTLSELAPVAQRPSGGRTVRPNETGMV